MTAAFEAAGRARGLVSAHFDLGGTVLRVMFAGRDLADALCPALQHLACAPAPAHVRVLAFESALSGVDLPGGLDRAGLRRGGAGKPARVAGFVGLAEEPGLLSLYWPDAGTGVAWAESAESLSQNERAAPFRPFFRWAMPARGLYLVHAAAVCSEEGAVLIVGPSGHGKSTSALACAAAGLGYIGDDYCLLGFEADVPVVHSLYSSGKVHAHNIQRLGAAGALLSAPLREGEKAMGFLNASGGVRVVRKAPVRAVLIPRTKGNPRAAIAPATPAAALRALAPSSLMQVPGPADGTLAALARLVRDVPAAFIDLPDDAGQIPAAIDELLAGLASRRS